MTAKKVTKKVVKEETPPTPVVEQKEIPIQEVEKKEIKVIERIIENREIAPQDAFGKMTRDQVELVKRTVAKGATDDELRLFIQVCKGANLNPFLKQVFLVKRWDSKEGREVGAIQVSIDGLRAIAEETGDYCGNEDPEFSGEEPSKIEGKDKAEKTFVHPKTAKVTIYKMVQGQRYPFSATARWEEYYPGQKMGYQWHQRPYLMLGKCAEALALRKAFPKLMSGMYAQEELDKGLAPQSPAEESAKAAQTVKNLISKMSMEDIDEFNAKMKASKKYTDEQKAEFYKLASARMEELTGEKIINQ